MWLKEWQVRCRILFQTMPLARSAYRTTTAPRIIANEIGECKMPERCHLIVGYVQDKALPSVTPEDARVMTHVNIAFGHIVDGRVSAARTANLDCLEKLREYNPSLEILLSVGGWGAGGFSEAAATAESRETFAESALEVVKGYRLDGIDLDYPCYSVAGIASSDKDNFTLMLKELRTGLDRQGQSDGRHYRLTPQPAQTSTILMGQGWIRSSSTDWVQLMTYDMRGGFQTLTGHHTNLFTPTEISSVRASMLVSDVRRRRPPNSSLSCVLLEDVERRPEQEQRLFQNSVGPGGARAYLRRTGPQLSTRTIQTLLMMKPRFSPA